MLLECSLTQFSQKYTTASETEQTFFILLFYLLVPKRTLDYYKIYYKKFNITVTSNYVMRTLFEKNPLIISIKMHGIVTIY